MARLLGIDIGTTGVRAVVIDQRGQRLAGGAQPCLHETPGIGRAEADPESWWSATLAALAQVDAEVPLSTVDAVGVTGQAPTAALVDDIGHPLRRAILWLDVRAAEEARAIDASLGPGRAEAIGGNRMHAYYLGPKLAWLRSHEPRLLQSARWVLQSHAFIAMRLTGEVACDASTAMLCSPLFDAGRGAWSPEGASAVGIDPRILPRIATAHEVLGAITPGAAARTGLRAGTPVVAGGGDFAASALSAGVFEEGDACLMLGTAGNLLLPLARPRFDSRLVNSHHVGCDSWLALGGTLCGAALEWFRGTCARDVDWRALEDEAATVPVGADGLIALPYFQGERTPIWHERARGVFFGVDLAHGRGHLYRALIEGIALGFRHCMTTAEESGARFREVVAVNGAGRSALLRQTLADALGVPLTWLPGAGGTVVGAAVLAGLGAGVFETPGVARSWAEGRTAERHLPDAETSATLGEVARRRAALYAAVGPLF